MSPGRWRGRRILDLHSEFSIFFSCEEGTIGQSAVLAGFRPLRLVIPEALESLTHVGPEFLKRVRPNDSRAFLTGRRTRPQN